MDPLIYEVERELADEEREPCSVTKQAALARGEKREKEKKGGEEKREGKNADCGIIKKKKKKERKIRGTIV